MAYITQWKLEVKDCISKNVSKLQLKEIKAYIEDNDDMQWVFGEGLFEWGEDDRSFDDSDDNMFNISKRFPNIIFTLKYDPIADEDEGMYIEYWLDGEVQREQIRYIVPEFDINKLAHIMD